VFERVAAREGKHHAQQRSHPERFTQVLSRAKPEEASVVASHQAVFVVCVDIPRSETRELDLKIKGVAFDEFSNVETFDRFYNHPCSGVFGLREGR